MGGKYTPLDDDSDAEYETIHTINSDVTINQADIPDGLISALDSPTENFGSNMSKLLSSDTFFVSKFSSKNDYNGL